MPYNPNRYSGKLRRAEDVGQLMRDINALEGHKADETLSTALTPQYGIVIGYGATMTLPRYIDVDTSGNIYLVDITRKKVIKFTAAGNYVAEWGTSGTSPGQFQDPYGIAIDSSNNVYVADNTRNKIIKFNTSGTYQSEFSSGAGPTGIDTDSSGNIYVGLNGATKAVEKYNSSGTLQATYTDATTIGTIRDVAVNSDGSIVYVTSGFLFGTSKIAKITTSGPTYSTISSSGTSAGQFQKPNGLEVDAAGNVYFTDETRGKVVKYDSSDTYVTEFGTSGTGAGQFSIPYGITISSITGSLYVVDEGRFKVIIFKGTIGSASTVTLTGAWGTETPQIFIDSSGNIYVARYGSPGYFFNGTHALRKYNSAGVVQATFGLCGLVATGNTCIGQNGASGVCADSNGNIYCISSYGSTAASWLLTKFNSSGTWQARTTLPYLPYHISINTSDVIAIAYIVSGTGKIYTYNTSGSSLSSWSLPSGYVATSIRKGTSGTFIVAAISGTSGKIIVYDSSGTALYTINTIPNYGTSYGADDDTSNTVLALDGDYNIDTYAISSGGLISKFNVGISSMAILRNTLNVESGILYVLRAPYYFGYLYDAILYKYTLSSFSNVFSSEVPDTASPTISSPTDVAPDATHIHITDTANNRVLKYTKADGAYVSTFGSAGSGNGQFSSPKGIAKDSSGNIWVVDSGNNRVQKFNSAGTYQSQFGSAGSGNGQFNNPDRIYIDASDNIYITDKGNHRVQVFNSSGSFLRKFGTNGSSNGNLLSPVGVAKNPRTGHVYVVNTGNHRTEVFYEFNANNAKYVSRWGSSGSSSTIRQFSSPEGIDTDSNGHMWIADTGNNRLARISSRGRLNTYYGSSGSGDGQFSSPSSVKIYGNELYVVDRGNNRIHKFIVAESAQLDTETQTQFAYAITKEDGVAQIRSMGTPDRGVHVPDLGALSFTPSADELGDNAGTKVSATKYISDMRRAVEKLAASGVFTDSSDGTAMDWSAGTSNLYKRALSGRHKMYGVDNTTGDAKRTWTRGAIRNKPLVDLDIGEIYETVRKLKESTWGIVE